MKCWSLRCKLILTLSVILFVSLLVPHLVSYHVSKKSLHTNLVEESLPLISSNIYSHIQKELMRPIHISSLMSNDTFVKDWILNGEKNVGEIQKYLNEIKEKYNFASVFLVSKITHNYYHYQGILKTIGPEDEHDDWFYHFLEMNVPIDLDVDTDEAAEDALTVFINHRLNDYEGNLIGVTGVGLSMERVGQYLSNYTGDHNRDVYLVNPDGIIQVHSDLSVIEQDSVFENKVIQDLAVSVKQSEANVGGIEYDREGRHYVLMIRYIPEFDWYLFVEQDETATLSGLRWNLIRNLLFGFFMAVVIIVINILTVNYFQRRLENLASKDALTGTNNRRLFMDHADVEFKRFRRYKKPVSIMMLDLDQFKDVNDTYGHMAGDEVLKRFVKECENDLRDTDILGRIGGEEFAAILTETDLDQANQIAERVRNRISSLNIDTDGKRIHITVSVGITELSTYDSSFEDAMKRVDDALYLAKHNGRNRVELVNPPLS